MELGGLGYLTIVKQCVRIKFSVPDYIIIIIVIVVIISSISLTKSSKKRNSVQYGE